MKRFVVLFLIIGTSLIFFMCSTDDPTAPKVKQAPDIRQSDQFSGPLEKKDTTYFSGTSTNNGILVPPKIINLPNGVVQWRGLVVRTADTLTDPRVFGIVTWVVHMNIYPEGNDKRWGTGELEIPHVGRWDMTYKGWFIPGEGLTYEVDGHGKGELRGLKAHWTYFLPNPPGVFNVQGYIIEGN